MKKIKFAENLRMFRKENNYTQTELANLVGVDQRTVSVWERGLYEPDLKTLEKLCEIFDISFDELLT